jgi:hypothetical protein
MRVGVDGVGEGLESAVPFGRLVRAGGRQMSGVEPDRVVPDQHRGAQGPGPADPDVHRLGMRQRQPAVDRDRARGGMERQLRVENLGDRRAIDAGHLLQHHDVGGQQRP